MGKAKDDKPADQSPAERIAAALAVLNKYDEPTLQEAIGAVEAKIAEAKARHIEPLERERRALVKCLMGRRMSAMRKKKVDKAAHPSQETDAPETSDDEDSIDNAVLATLSTRGQLTAGQVAHWAQVTTAEATASLGRLVFGGQVVRHGNGGLYEAA